MDDDSNPNSTEFDRSFDESYTLWAREALDELPESFTITDPRISGHPIVFASRGFSKMTGYARSEVVGRNGRVFQGPATNRRSVMEIREAVREERPVQVVLVNYRKDGTPFRMLFQMCPVFGRAEGGGGGGVLNFVAVQVPITTAEKKKKKKQRFENDCVSDVVFGSCRREICPDSLLELGRVLALDSSDVREPEIEEPCEANEVEKRRASSAINNILSVLTHYSESTGRVVCLKRSSLSGVCNLSSSLTISLGRIKQSFVLIDNHLPETPIVYVSDAFLKLTGYSRHEVLGNDCRFLNGVDTDLLISNQIEESIQTEQSCTVRILSYRKDKSSFWNFLHLSPVRNATGKIAYIVGVHMEDGCNNNWDGRGLSPEKRQLSTVGSVKVAVRSSSMGAGSSKS